MKVELEKLEMNISPLTDEVYVGIKEKNKDEWKHKVNLTNNFIGCVIQRWNGFKQTITSETGKKYVITVEEIK